MSRNDLWKWLTLAILAVLSIYVTFPAKEKIRLGLDLKGGTSFIVAIDEAKLRSSIMEGDPDAAPASINRKVNAVLENADARAVEVIRNRIDGLGVNEPVIQSGNNHRITIQLPGIDADKRQMAEESIKAAAFLEFKLVHKLNDELVRKAIDSGRVPEGYEYADDGRSFVRTPQYQELRKDPKYARRLSLFEVPDPRYAFMLQKVVDSTGQTIYRPNFVLRNAEMTGADLKSASVESDPMSGRFFVSLEFNQKGAMDFARVTKAYAPGGSRNKNSEVGRQLAIVLDGTLYSAPQIRTEIPNGKAVIEGSFTLSEAAQLRNILNAGSLPAPMKVLEKRVVDSTLGRDAVRSGITAGAIATVLVALFMLIYYTYCGLIANAALLLDLLLLPAGMVIVSNLLGVFVRDAGIAGKTATSLPVLTMPGIAGIVLTLGMAVDANVLIFERIREEFGTGKSARAAISSGYDRAFLSIFDSNITTLLTASILFIVGVGPIRGFAITLSAGILISMFTALIVTRLIFDLSVPEGRMKPYKMLSLVKTTNFDFIGIGKKALITSGVILVVTLIIFFGRAFTSPTKVLAVDFTGGSSMSFSFDQRADIGAVRDVITTVDSGAVPQYQSSLDDSNSMLLVKTGLSEIDGQNISVLIEEALQQKLPENNFALKGEEGVGSEIGTDLKRSAFWAVTASLIVILLYVSIRFEFGFALGAVAALVHDAFITLGIYSLCGRQVSLPIIAALLTIVGYSINDTIVVSDRIREDLRKDPKTDFKTLCNRAINATLSRTVLTSLTTLLALTVLFIFGGGSINDFALAMLIGVVAGTYSTIFIATPVMLAWYKGHRPKFAIVKKN
jgi:SecD/SecF fusion protein